MSSPTVPRGWGGGGGVTKPSWWRASGLKGAYSPRPWVGGPWLTRPWPLPRSLCSSHLGLFSDFFDHDMDFPFRVFLLLFLSSNLPSTCPPQCTHLPAIHPANTVTSPPPRRHFCEGSCGPQTRLVPGCMLPWPPDLSLTALSTVAEDVLALCSLAHAGAHASGNATGAGLLPSCWVLTPKAQPRAGPVAHAQCA